MFILLITLFFSQTHAKIIRPFPPLQTIQPPQTLQTIPPVEWCDTNAEQTGECDVGCANCRFPDQICFTSGITECSCLPGYVINTEDNTCVAVNALECRAQRFYSIVQLPPTCEVNEQFVYCGVCDATCVKPCLCGRCVCLDGYLRDRYGNCILATTRSCVRESIILDPITAISI